MGKIIKINPATIKPSQDFLKKETFNFIKENYHTGNFDKLPPTPIVRNFPDGGYIAIDGHNLLAFFYSKSMACEVYLAENKDDGILGSSDMIKKRNADLEKKYDTVIDEYKSLEEKNIRTIKDLYDNAAPYLA